MGVIRVLTVLVPLCFSLACAQGHCRRKKDPPSEPKQVGLASESGPTQNPTSGRVLVYKYDGSLQCGQGKAIPLEIMARQLQGVTIFSSYKKADGLMHIQVCGSPTGIANVYEIAAKDLPLAEGKGFKKWAFE